MFETKSKVSSAHSGAVYLTSPSSVGSMVEISVGLMVDAGRAATHITATAATTAATSTLAASTFAAPGTPPLVPPPSSPPPFSSPSGPPPPPPPNYLLPPVVGAVANVGACWLRDDGMVLQGSGRCCARREVHKGRALQ